MPASNIAVIGSRPPSMSGSPAPRMTLVASSTVPNSLRGMPIMSQMTSSGNGCESASTRSTSPCSHMLVDHFGADRLDRVEHAPASCLGRERAGDDAPLSRVSRVVHVDERPEELQRLRRHVGDRHGTPPRAEVLGPPADLDDLRVAGRDPERLGQTRHRVLERRGEERADLAELGEARHAVLSGMRQKAGSTSSGYTSDTSSPSERRRPFRSTSIFAHLAAAGAPNAVDLRAARLSRADSLPLTGMRPEGGS